MTFRMVYKSGQIFFSVLTQCTRLTDRRTDGRTDRQTDGQNYHRSTASAFCIACSAVKTGMLANERNMRTYAVSAKSDILRLSFFRFNYFHCRRHHAMFDSTGS